MAFHIGVSCPSNECPEKAEICTVGYVIKLQNTTEINKQALFNLKPKFLQGEAGILVLK